MFEFEIVSKFWECEVNLCCFDIKLNYLIEYFWVWVDCFEWV